jgi:anti-sigma factor RsiW
MTCADALDRLDDYVDGALPEGEGAEVLAHLRGCEACRAEETLLRAILEEARALPKERAPQRDLWPAIAQEIAGTGKVAAFPARPAARRVWIPALAAAAAVILAVSVFVRTGPSGPGPLGSPETVPVSAGRVDLLDAEEGYARATADLMAVLAERADTLSPQTRQSVERNLAVIDQALKEIRDALEKEPGNPELTRMLTATHRKKVDVLRRVVRLTQASL